MKSYAFKFGIVVGTIGIIGCEPNKTEINFSGSKSSANTSSALQKSSGSGATALGVKAAGDLVGTELSSSDIKDLISAKDTKKLTDYINEDKSGSALYEKMKELCLDSEFASNMTFTVDVYYYKNGKNGEMDWLPDKEFYYSESLKRFLIKGARKNDDGSDKPIRYSLGNFDIYPNNNEKKVYNFRNIKVVKKESSEAVTGSDIPLSKLKDLISAKDTEQLTNYINKDKSGPELHKKMKELCLDSEFASNMTFTVDVYYYKNGMNGEMDWLPGKEFYYSKSLNRFIMKGARKNADDSDKPIWYSLKDFDTYPNNNGKTKYNFRNIKVVISDKKYHEFTLKENNAVYQLAATHIYKLMKLQFLYNNGLGTKSSPEGFSVYSNGSKNFSMDEFEDLKDYVKSKTGTELSFRFGIIRILYLKDDDKLATDNEQTGMSFEELHRNMKEKPGSVKVYETPDDKNYYSSTYHMTAYTMVAIDEGDKKFKLEYKDTDGKVKPYKTFSFEDVKNHLKSFEYFYFCDDYLMNARMRIGYTADELYSAIENGEGFYIRNKMLAAKDGSFYLGDWEITKKAIYNEHLSASPEKIRIEDTWDTYTPYELKQAIEKGKKFYADGEELSVIEGSFYQGEWNMISEDQLYDLRITEDPNSGW